MTIVLLLSLLSFYYYYFKLFLMYSYSLVMIHTILPFFICLVFFFIFRWLHSDNFITFFSNTNAMDNNYTAIFLVFSPRVSRIPCCG